MNINDALNILNLSQSVTKKEIKKAYKAASLKYHPDRNPAEAETMKLINLAYDFLRSLDSFESETIEATEDFQQTDYSEEFNTVLSALFVLQERENADFEIEICGNWIWISGNTKPFAKQLGRKEGGIGCYFCKKNGGCWYYRPEQFKSKNRKSCSMNEIRELHGSHKPVYGKNRKYIAA
ncbi:DnaJ domain-containing protein [uncultured Shewanella sp.]|uniref:DnaJ domain-containing protein n=1 Tax=uncultured Shewanella sp. TaxID=173975 RepID=UPI002639ECFA|nr:DnaJ domain-containing protein [uncultured Shewanella sp.]